MNTLTKGTPVGTPGVVDSEVGEGYGVKVTASFSNAGQSTKETRVVYFDASELTEA